jgi:hypothetical protein
VNQKDRCAFARLFVVEVAAVRRHEPMFGLQIMGSRPR